MLRHVPDPLGLWIGTCINILAEMLFWPPFECATSVIRKARFSQVLYLAFFDGKMCYSGDILRTARKLKHARHKLDDRKTGLGLPQMPLDAAIGRLFAPYRPCGHHGHRFWRTKSSCGIVKSLFHASFQKGNNRTLYSAHRSDKLRRQVKHHD